MRRLLLLLAVLLAGGCADGDGTRDAAPTPTLDVSAFDRVPAEAGDHEVEVTWQGNPRRFLLHVPADLPDRAVPLVVALHGLQGSPEEMAGMSRLSALADRDGFLVLYPAAYGADFNSAACCGYIDDVGLIKAGIDALAGRWSVDPDRIYATGMSAGGVMVIRLAADLPGVFAAIAPIASARGSVVRDDPTAMLSSAPVSYFSVVGRADPSYERFRDDLAARLSTGGCASAGERPGSTPEIAVIEAECADGSEVRFLSVDGLGHAWPYELYPGTGIADLMWEFFVNHPRIG